MTGTNDFDLVIFDCDGVVADSEALACRGLAEVLQRHGLPLGPAEVMDRFLGRSFAAVEAYYREATGRPVPDSLRREVADHLAGLLRTSLKPVPHIFEVLDALDRPYCLASSSDMDRIRLTLAVTGLDARFGDRVFNAAMVKHGKPAPDLFLHVSSRMAARPERTLVVEDSVTGVVAGKAAGMTVWGFTGGSHYAGRDFGDKLAAAGADRVFNSMTEFATG